MDTSLQQDGSINISQFLSKDYYEKFKMGQNLYEASMTLSRLSIGDKTSEDFNNNTQFKIMNIQERLSEELYKNQLLENKILNLQSQLQSSIEHTTILQRQNESKQNEIVALTQKYEKLSKNYDVEKLLNAQMSKKIVDLQQQIKKGGLPFSDRKHEKSKQSISSRQQNQPGTEDSTVKDTSVSDLKSLDKPFHSATAQNFYKSSTKFWSPQNQTLEKRIEATLSQIRAIKQQFQQLK